MLDEYFLSNNCVQTLLQSIMCMFEHCIIIVYGGWVVRISGKQLHGLPWKGFLSLLFDPVVFCRHEIVFAALSSDKAIRNIHTKVQSIPLPALFHSIPFVSFGFPASKPYSYLYGNYLPKFPTISCT